MMVPMKDSANDQMSALNVDKAIATSVPPATNFSTDERTDHVAINVACKNLRL